MSSLRSLGYIARLSPESNKKGSVVECLPKMLSFISKSSSSSSSKRKII
jgi:hypothetical protein